MRKIISAFNITLDGYCQHTAGMVDAEIHEYYNDLLRQADTMIWGRTTYQLMEGFWPEQVVHPSGDKAQDDFAVLIDGMRKIVYSRTLDAVRWKNSELRNELLADEILALKAQEGKNILVGSRSLITEFTKLGLIDEYRLLIHPTFVGGGLKFLEGLDQKVDLTLTATKTFAIGSIMLHYTPRQK
ncbi:MAG: dihydrofolate reductase family protein [Bacteroidetes bacterium]|nr:dihydrofolate reductase family protein [Bacteroidota bacterium]